MVRRGDMPSATIVVTAVSSFLGFLLNTGIMILILLRGRKAYHFLFAGILLLCANWDFGIFLTMIRNSHLDELPMYGYIICTPCTFFMVLFYHFTGAYLNRVKKKTTIAFWALCLASAVLILIGPGEIVGVYQYRWGNLFRPDQQMLLWFIPSMPLYWLSIGASIFMLSQAYREEPSLLARRHMRYIMICFIAIGLALIKLLALIT